MNNNLLPIGSVVLLKEATKKVMITGFYIKSTNDSSKIYDYVGCLYPEGVLNSDQNLLFDHYQISQIFFRGYENEEEAAFKKQINDMITSLQKENMNPPQSEPIPRIDPTTPVATITLETDLKKENPDSN